MTYLGELTDVMTWFGTRDQVVFLGQSVSYPGNSLYQTLAGVPPEKRLELPVAEELQLGVSLGMAIKGKEVISIFPRMDFLLCAMSQLVNHLDKDIYPLTGKVIIRTCVGATRPMNPGVQHCGDYTEGLEKVLKFVKVVRLLDARKIQAAYLGAYASREPAWLMIEYGDLYGEHI